MFEVINGISFKKFDAKSIGGAYGVNIDGKLHMSTDEYSMDIRYGLTPAILKRPKTIPISMESMNKIGLEISPMEQKLFASAQSAILRIE